MSEGQARYSVIVMDRWHPRTLVTLVTFESSSVRLESDCTRHVYQGQAYVLRERTARCTCTVTGGMPPSGIARWLKAYWGFATETNTSSSTLQIPWQAGTSSFYRCRVEHPVLKKVEGFFAQPKEAEYILRYEVPPEVQLDKNCSEPPTAASLVICTCRLVTSGDPPARVKWFKKDGSVVSSLVAETYGEATLTIIGIPRQPFLCKGVNSFGMTHTYEEYPPPEGLRFGKMKESGKHKHESLLWIFALCLAIAVALVALFGVLCGALWVIRRRREQNVSSDESSDATSSDVTGSNMTTGQDSDTGNTVSEMVDLRTPPSITSDSIYINKDNQWAKPAPVAVNSHTDVELHTSGCKWTRYR
ncbi:uncharacterized protein LOC106014167 [Aplysia californica]|uniref:Uncharacterized protein LOC106014167 n=1 Tax=Aplysia californica TaxID=6500 RepID=A0ABM1AFL9_APLCA|nr:uncharacterized protein LOC106014167 [Aplysia californica]